MRDRIFLDTNIILYAKLESDIEKDKTDHIIKILRYSEEQFVISTQVLIEITNQLFKNKVQDTIIRNIAEAIEEEFELHPVNTSTIKKAIDIKSKYKFSFWDSLIVASALENKCGILYTEDLQHGQVIETNLKVVNPFK